MQSEGDKVVANKRLSQSPSITEVAATSDNGQLAGLLLNNQPTLHHIMADVRLLLKQTSAARSHKTSAEGNGKKRKASAVLSSPDSKKPRPPASTSQASEVDQKPPELPSKQTDAGGTGDVGRLGDDQHAADLAALHRELAIMDAQQAEANSQATPTISAPPMTADEIAKSERDVQRESRDAELEGEREDAAKALEDEFEAMDGFEERAKKLRARREELRKSESVASLQQTDKSYSTAAQRLPSATSSLPHAGPTVDGAEGEDEDRDDDDEDLSWDFGRQTR
ncbi:hypothetical protein CERZMDRAFT_85753 [Cercospora zeae-maydis SCOH1-5]|uniref:Uncharacterized protein n=1 Tax=Cercospora zeae-maydis SCOH1-5 TaxID=717836 RepID=A0A6A6FBM2_9PEZI|nr:hypothetical protein CERZMDRAFT_85753 [Cercospora zeae-maydis SCOH1-5]